MSLLRILIALPLLPAAFGQEFRATLQGTITDPSQSGIPDAVATLKNVDTGVERETKTNEVGYYIFNYLQPGSYTLTIKAAGFKTAVRQNLGLSLGDNLRVDQQLELGAAAESITVTGEVALVQTDSSSLGAVVNRQMVDVLPLKGHSSLFMFNLATGVVNNRYWEDARPNDTGTNVLFSANGSPVATGDVAIDGVSSMVNVNRGLGISPWVPTMESVGEFKLQMGTLPAEYGRSGGSFTNIVIRSGTNDLHGSLYYFHQNSALNANYFFPRGQGQKLPAFASNLFGFSIGGPILLPRVYNGRNRTFFFYNYEGAREGNGQSTIANVPTLRMRSGDFSEFRGAIFDPFSVRGVDGAPIRDPFPGNLVPQNQQDPVARNILRYWPEPNSPTTSASSPWVQNFVQSSKWPRDYDTWVLKFDHQLTSRHQTFFRMNKGEGRLVFNYVFDGLATPGRNRVTRPHLGFAVNDTFLMNPHTTLDTRLGFMRGGEKQRPWSIGFDMKSLGFPDAFVRSVQAQSFPIISVTDMQGLAGSGYAENLGDSWSLQSSLTHHISQHLIKAGFDGRLYRGNFFRNNNPSGSFSFGPQSTGGPRADTPQSGFGLASMMVGYGSGSIAVETGLSIQNVYYAGFIQDDFRVSRRLTLNMGLRYEYESPRTERYDRTVRGFAYNTPSPLKVPGLDLRGGLLYAGAGGLPRGLYDPDRNNLAPRFGFAFSATKTTILRGGYALSYIPVVYGVIPTGYSNTTPLVSSLDGITPKDLLRNPFPDGFLPPIGNTQGLVTLVGQSVTFIDPSDRTPMFHNWHFDIQRELPSSTVFEVAYVGSRAIKVVAQPSDFLAAVNENVNQLHPSHLSKGTALLQPVANPFFGILTTGSLSGRTVQAQQLLRPYPHFTGVTRNAPAFGNTVYHAVQMRLEKRFSRGLTALISYTRSKNIGDVTTAQNAYDRKAERTVTEFDVPQRLTLAATYQLPFGEKRRYLSNAPRVVDLLAGGWQITTLSTFQEGFAMGFGLTRAAVGSGSGRPNAAGDPTEGVSGAIVNRLNRYFNTDAFSQPPDFTYGNLSPRIGTVRNPGMNNVNLSVSKRVRLFENWNVEFRASSFNFLNHPVFSSPNTTFGSATFGKITGQANQNRQTEFMMRIVF